MGDGFFDLSEKMFREDDSDGKDLDAIRDSAKRRNSLILQFGGRENLPSSLLKADRKLVDKEQDNHAAMSYENSTPQLERANNEQIPKNLRSAYYISGRGCRNGALSRFPQNVGRTVLMFYSKPGDVVFDPFAGHNSRMELCITNGRHYVGCDLSKRFMESNRERAKFLCKEYPKALITLHHTDSKKVSIPDETGAFTLTSPPYWDIEDYGDEPEQLGKSKTYTEFMSGICQVMKENFRVLKPGAFAVWFINDFRRKGKMYFYHVDIMRAGQKAGFVPHDILIVDLGKSIRDCFINQAVDTKILPKRHEYGIVFSKPK